MGSDEGQQGDSWPGQAPPPLPPPREHSHPGPPPSSRLGPGGRFLKQTRPHLVPRPSATCARKGAHTDRALSLGGGRGGGRLEGPCPSQALGERGFCGAWPPPDPTPPTVGTFLGRGLASSARTGPWGGGQRLGWRLSMGLCASSQEASVAELTALTLQPTGPCPPGPRQPCPAQPSPVVQCVLTGTLPCGHPGRACCRVAAIPVPWGLAQ